MLHYKQTHQDCQPHRLCCRRWGSQVAASLTGAPWSLSGPRVPDAIVQSQQCRHPVPQMQRETPVDKINLTRSTRQSINKIRSTRQSINEARSALSLSTIFTNVNVNPALLTHGAYFKKPDFVVIIWGIPELSFLFQIPSLDWFQFSYCGHSWCEPNLKQTWFLAGKLRDNSAQFLSSHLVR